MVYIVDDDQNIRDAFVMLLKSAGYEYTAFGSADNFLTNYEPEARDILLLDMNLIGMDGCTLLQTLMHKRLQLPVIVITAFDEPKYRKCSREYGVLAYLQKPVDSNSLFAIINYRAVKQKSTNTNIPQ
jgi:FixJ family two-component response regulator